uniref:ZZ-type domain-containing protein n=1 Tax=Sander lucioperca TaxID=283035 RepID=A0A8C9XWT7_SANLU
MTSCFNEVATATASVGHVMSWLQSEPRLLLWLPALYRLSVSQNVQHTVRCHACKTRPITGLRYRCVRCVNIQLCQSCFLTDKHKTHHPVKELHTQPTWRESLSSFVHTARHRLLPRRSRKRAEPAEPQDSAPPPSGRDVSHDATLRDVSHDASLRPASCSSKALQTDDVTPPQMKASVLMTEVRNLQRDRWLMEQQLQAFRLTVQSEQGILEDRCSDMEVTMETLREHNLRLQRTLSQALNKMEAQHHADNTLQSANTVTTVTTAATERETFTPTSDSERNPEEEEEFLKTEDEWSEEELQTPSPTMHRDTSPSHDSHCGEEEGAELQREGAEPHREGAELQEEEDSCCVCEAEDCGTWSPEELLQETMERLKTELQTDRRTERQTGETQTDKETDR